MTATRTCPICHTTATATPDALRSWLADHLEQHRSHP